MKLLKVKLLVVAALMFAASSAFGSYGMDFNVNTSSLNGQSGYLELQLSPGPVLGAANALVSNYSSDAALLVGAPVLTGDVSGALPASVTLTNSNGLYQARPYLTAATSGLAAGASVTVPVQFSNPANARITFTTATFQE